MSSFTHYRVKNEHQIPEIAGYDEEPSADYLQVLRNKMRIDIRSLTDECVEFDLIGVDASVANALRRIMLAEVCLYTVILPPIYRLLLINLSEVCFRLPEQRLLFEVLSVTTVVWFLIPSMFLF